MPPNFCLDGDMKLHDTRTSSIKEVRHGAAQ